MLFENHLNSFNISSKYIGIKIFEMILLTVAVVGDKLGRWLKTPFDVISFGPRASAGALVSAPERLQTL
jgi:hypothetical protein